MPTLPKTTGPATNETPAQAPAPATPAEQPAEPKAAPKGRKPKVVLQATQRPIVYKEIKATLFLAGSEKGPITAALAKKLMGWETEKEFAARLMQGNPELTEDACKFDKKTADGQTVNSFCENVAGEKVACWNNVGNRPFDQSHGDSLAQDILFRKWADSRNGANMSINGESIVLTVTGRVDSGQHRLYGVIRAFELWEANPKKYPLWQEPPSIEGLVVAGVSENPLVTQTIDNTKPRGLDDVLCTSFTFKDLKDPTDKKTMGRYLAGAIDVLWQRTGVPYKGETKIHQTHSASLDFLSRHARLERYVKHIFDEDANRSIALLRLGRGEMAAVCYLMATSGTDAKAYLGTRKESKCDFAMESKAEGFFVQLVLDSRNIAAGKTAKGPLTAVVHALGNLADDETGLGGRRQEKLAIIARAWAIYKNGKDVRDADVKLEYHTNDLGVKHLMPDANGYLNWFGGIDVGELPTAAKSDSGEDPADDNDMEAKKEKAKTDTDAAAAKKREENKAKLLANRAAKNGTATPATKPASATAGK